MAQLIANNLGAAGRMTNGERRFAERLQQKLDDEYLCWYNVPVGAKYQYPDFLVMHPNHGFLVLEVKDWKIDTFAEVNRSAVTINTETGRKTVANPLEQARQYMFAVKQTLERDPQLQHREGRHAGKIIMPYGFGVVLTNISRKQFDDAELGNFISPDNVICQDEMTESADVEAFQKRLWDMFFFPFPCALTLPQIDRVRWHLFPQLRIHQGNIFDPPKDEEAPVEIPSIIKVMDMQQERIAREMGDGHRVVRGVAGSGKTMLLGYRCVEMARRHEKPVLALCFNKTLAARLEQMAAAHGVQDRVNVFHFHGWCEELRKTYALPPCWNSDFGVYEVTLLKTIIDAVDKDIIPRGQYAAIVIDEGQDFQPEWFKLIVQMVDPDTDSILIVHDDTQTLYGNVRKLKHSWKSLGINAIGRGHTHVLKVNYRNTLEILGVAKAFLGGILTERVEREDDDNETLVPESIGNHGPMPELLACRDTSDEADRICRLIDVQLKAGADPNDIAVLCPFDSHAQNMQTRLEKAGIPAEYASKTNRRTLFSGSPSVKVMTIHSSKGLEFDTVYIHQVDKIGTKAGTDDELEVDSRLLYVGMTRAQRKLTLLHHGSNTLVERLGNALDEVRQRLAA